MPSNSGYTLSIECILKEAKFRWLKGYEVLCILQNYQQYNLQLSPAPPVEPQSGSLFLFNKRLVKFRKDGVNWRKQKDGKTVRESHEKLKVGGVKVLSCCYTRSADNPSFQRRIYWLLDGDSTIVLVHYLTMEKENGSPREEGADLEFSLDDYDSPAERMVLRSHRIQIDNTEEDDSQSDSDFSDQDGGNNTIPNGASSIGSSLPNESNLMEFVNSLITPNEGNYMPLNKQPICEAVSTPISNFEETTSITSTVGRLAKITDFSPNWDYVEGGSKLLILGPDFHSGLTYYCMFDQVEVPAELVQDGVLKCAVPNHYKPGFVSFCVTRGNFMLFSEVYRFEFRSRDAPSDLINMNDRSFKMRIIERFERLEREANSINAMTLSENIVESLTHSLEEKNISEEELEQNFVEVLVNLMSGMDNSETINSQDRDGFTLLHYACALGYHSLASHLIQRGANVNIQDKSGCTPFHWAMKNRDHEMIKILVDYLDLNKVVYPQCESLSKNLDINFPSIRSPSMDGLISGIDGLGIQLGSPAIHRVKETSSAHSSPRTPRTPRTPHLGVKSRQAVRIREKEGEEDEDFLFKTFRAKREDDSKRRASKARDTKIAQKRK